MTAAEDRGVQVEALDLGPIRARRQRLLATADTITALGHLNNDRSVHAIAEAAVSSANDVPDLLDEIDRLRALTNEADR